MKKKYAYGMLLFVTMIWGGGFIATSSALKSVSPFYIMMIRFLGASILPLILSFKKLKNMEKEYILFGLLTGVLLFLAFSFQTFGLQYSTPSKNAFLTATNVIFVPYLLWICVKRKPKSKEIVASMLCALGIGLLTLRSDALGITSGDTLSLVCAVFFALHIIALERISKHVDAFALTSLQMISAGVLSAICAVCFETLPDHISMNAMGSLFYLIFISTLLAYLLQTIAQKYTSANTASLILSMEALFASLFSFFLFQERMSIQMMIGAFLIFSSVIYVEYHPKKTLKKQQND